MRATDRKVYKVPVLPLAYASSSSITCLPPARAGGFMLSLAFASSRIGSQSLQIPFSDLGRIGGLGIVGTFASQKHLASDQI